MRLSLSTACALLLITSANAQTIDFRGVPFGARESEWAEKVGIRCETTPERFNLFGDRSCLAGGSSGAVTRTYGGAVARLIAAYFLRDELSSIMVTFDADDFDGIRNVLVERFGKPTTIERPEFVTRAGLSGRNEVLTWVHGNVRLTARRFSDSITEGSAWYFYLPHKASLDARASERNSRAAKGL